jgi:non-reducing end alpha-L-arabinofuranosidase
MPPQGDANRGTMLTVNLLRRTNVALVVLAGVACTKIIGLEALPELGNGAASGSGQSGGTGQTGGTFSSGGRSANGGAVSNGGSVATGGSTGDGGGEAGASSGIGGSALGGTSGAGGLMDGGGGSGGTDSSGGSSTTGGSTGNGGRGAGGSSGTGGNDVGGTSGTGGGTSGAGGAGGKSGAGGTGGTPPASDGPCDIYAEADTPCVGAYSTIRRLRKAYTGPLYQVRSGSSAQNTGTGGLLHDIAMTADGFADASAQDAACAGSICTISRVYDQSGNDNHLSVAKKGPAGTTYSDQDDFESIADGEELTVGDHRVYSLYMAARQGYRLPVRGSDVPFGSEAQGLYMLADGSRVGSQCCWDFGNVSVDPTVYTSTNALFFGTAYWGKGAGAGPWFMADFATGIWAGGSIPDEPGYGDFSDLGPANPNNPSLLVPFALGFLKTDATKYALRMANAQSASSVTTAYQGNLPHALDNQGAIVLGVGADNSNNSSGTFYEGAVLSGFPTDAAELDVLLNIKAAGYGQ